jgi:hypothetical protein
MLNYLKWAQLVNLRLSETKLNTNLVRNMVQLYGCRIVAKFNTHNLYSIRTFYIQYTHFIFNTLLEYSINRFIFNIYRNIFNIFAKTFNNLVKYSIQHLKYSMCVLNIKCAYWILLQSGNHTINPWTENIRYQNVLWNK